MDRIVLAYSGGVEAEAALAWLRERERAEIITVTLDVGQARELASVRDRALASGAARAHVLDAKEECARNYVLPALRAGAMESGSSSLIGAIVRPLIARSLVDIALIEHATTVAYAGPEHNGFGDMVRACNPQLRVIVPDIPVTRAAALVSAPPVTESPNEAAAVEISFERGVPVAVNGVPMPLLELVNALGAIAGIYGVGRTRSVEHHGASPTLEAPEVPAAAVLQTAYGALRAAIASPDLEAFFSLVSHRYADLIREGGWFTPLKHALDAFVDTVQDEVTGVVRIALVEGRCEIAGVRRVLSSSSIAPVAPAATATTETLSQPVLVTT